MSVCVRERVLLERSITFEWGNANYLIIFFCSSKFWLLLSDAVFRRHLTNFDIRSANSGCQRQTYTLRLIFFWLKILCTCTLICFFLAHKTSDKSLHTNEYEIQINDHFSIVFPIFVRPIAILTHLANLTYKTKKHNYKSENTNQKRKKKNKNWIFFFETVKWFTELRSEVFVVANRCCEWSMYLW